MKITDRLKGDHKTFLKMIQELDFIVREHQNVRDHKRLARLVELFKDQLALHAWFEDKFYYPAVSESLSKSAWPGIDQTYMQHLANEHKTIDGYLDRLEHEVKCGAGEQSVPVTTWPQTYALFMHGLKAHMKKEEEELFPASEKLLGGTCLEELSREVERHRSEAPKVRLHTH